MVERRRGLKGRRRREKLLGRNRVRERGSKRELSQSEKESKRVRQQGRGS